MQFISLEHAFSQDFIKSLPHLTWLKLSANEKLIIELILSFKRQGNDFFMNHATVAEYLVLGNTKTKAKSVGNIISKLKKKGYITTSQSHNYNGKNGGSSSTIVVDEVFLEQKLKEAFNTSCHNNNVSPETYLKNKTCISDVTADEAKTVTNSEVMTLKIDYSNMNQLEFTNHLQSIIKLDCMSDLSEEIQILINNNANWELQSCKGGLDYLIKNVK